MRKPRSRKKCPMWCSLVVVILLAAAVFAGIGDGSGTGLTEPRPSEAVSLPMNPPKTHDGIPAGVSQNGWTGIVRQIREDQHRIVQQPSTCNGVTEYQAVNPGSRLRAYFRQDGMELVPLVKDNPSWSLKMALTAAGLGDDESELPSPMLTASGNEAHYRRGAIVEWYRNDERGLEQGFTIEKPPGGKEANELTLSLRAAGTLTPKASGNGREVLFHDPDGRVAVRYGGLLATDARGQSLPVRLSLSRLADSTPNYEIRIAVDTFNATYPVTVDPVFSTGEVKLTASDAAAYDSFGWSVAISGDTVVVGAVENDGAGTDSGAAYIFSRNSGGADYWGQVKKITASGAAAGDFFGWSVAISGSTLVVGAPYSSNAGLLDSGAAYIFSRNWGGADYWGQVKKITVSGAAVGDFFGRSVAISGDSVVVGAPGKDGAGTDSGAVYIFSRNSGGADYWGQVEQLTASDAAAYDYFGQSVAIGGDTAVVGAYGNDDAGETSGSTYIFSRNFGGADHWGEVKKLTASDAAAEDFFGCSLAISGDTVVVGADGKDGAGSKSGAAYVFSRNSGGADNWGQVKKLTASDAAAEDFFGYSLAISGDTVVVGAVEKNGAGTWSGSVYIFSRNSGGADNWGQVKKLTASDAAAYDHFGWSVAISGDTVAVGAPHKDGAGAKSGAAYVYPLEYQQWTQRKKESAPAGAFGWSAAVTEDLLAVGAPSDGTSGAVYLFYRNRAGGPDTWEQKFKINGYADGEQFGWAVALSGDQLAVGAPYNDNAGTDCGAAYLFYRNLGGLDAWGKVKTLTASDGGGLFGWSLAIGDDTVAVGAPGNFLSTGAAYLFYRNTGGKDSWGEAKRVNASDPWLGNQFGWAVSLDRDTLAVGAPLHDSGKGAVYIYARNYPYATPDNWGQVRKKMALDAETDDHFGYALALSNNQLVVGAPEEDSLGSSAGAVYLFYRNYGGEDGWGQATKVLAMDGAAGHGFGWSVGKSGDRAVVTSGGGERAYLLERNSGGADQWGCVYKLTPSDGAANFGFSSAMANHFVVVGATNSNSAYLFEHPISVKRTTKTMPWLLLLMAD